MLIDQCSEIGNTDKTMARRYDHSREELGDMALKAARRMVAHHGVRALSTRKVAKEIGYSVGTIYNLYENLDDLIVHMNASVLDDLKHALMAAPAAETAEQRLKNLAAAYITFTRGNLNLWNSLFDHRLPPGEDVPDWYRQKVGELIRLIEQAIGPEFDRTHVLERQQSAWVLWSALHGVCSLANTEKLDIVATDNVWQLTEQLIETYLAGIGARFPKGGQ